jgi:parallel beta-helix repeat protein
VNQYRRLRTTLTLAVWTLASLWATPCVGHTIKTVNPGGGANYTSLFDANESLPNPLDADYQINCSGSTDDTTCVIIGCNTNGHELVIQGDNTTGIENEATYQLHIAAVDTALRITSTNVIVRNLEIVGTSSSYNAIYITGNTVLVEKCVVHGFTKATYGGICFATGTTDRYAWNNACYGNSIGIRVSQTQAGIFNNTCVGNSTYGIYIQEGGTVTVKNNLCSGNTTADYGSGS